MTAIWETFFRGSGRSFDDVLAAARQTSEGAQLIPDLLARIGGEGMMNAAVWRSLGSRWRVAMSVAGGLTMPPPGRTP